MQGQCASSLQQGESLQDIGGSAWMCSCACTKGSHLGFIVLIDTLGAMQHFHTRTSVLEVVLLVEVVKA